MFRLTPSIKDTLMAHCLALADEHKGGVGAIIVSREGDIIGEGYRMRVGQKGLMVHAERAALHHVDPKNAARIKGSTLITSLEPCVGIHAHQQAMSCAEYIKKFGIARVVAGMYDDNKHIAGRGIEFLRRNGLQVEIYDRFGPVVRRQIHEHRLPPYDIVDTRTSFELYHKYGL